MSRAVNPDRVLDHAARPTPSLPFVTVSPGPGRKVEQSAPDATLAEAHAELRAMEGAAAYLPAETLPDLWRKVLLALDSADVARDDSPGGRLYAEARAASGL